MYEYKKSYLAIKTIKYGAIQQESLVKLDFFSIQKEKITFFHREYKRKQEHVIISLIDLINIINETGLNTRETFVFIK